MRSSLRDLADAGVDPRQVAENFGDALLRGSEERERLTALLSLLAAYEAKLRELGVLAPVGASSSAPRSARLPPPG